MAKVGIDHDRLFKELLSTFFNEFLQLFLPEVAALIEPGSVRFIDKEVWTDVTSGERHEADLVARVDFAAHALATAGRPGRHAYFLIHIENQAKRDPYIGERIFRYFARLREKHGVAIYPIVLFSYLQPHNPEPDSLTVAFPDLEVLSFRYRVIQLNQLSWRDFVRHPNPVASALMSRMKMAPEERPHVKLQCLRLLVTLKLDPARQQLISGFVDTYLRLSEIEEQQYRKELEAEAPRRKEALMQLETSWSIKGRQEGLQEGRQQGLQEGRVEGRQEGRLEGRQEAMSEFVLQLLLRRLGPLPASLQTEIQKLSPERLRALNDASLDLDSVAHLREFLGRRQ